MSRLDGHVASLLEKANQAGRDGRFTQAGRLFDQVATAENGRGRDEAASTALRFSSCMHRFGGDVDTALDRARRATIGRRGSEVRVAALVELGEAFRQAGRDRDAIGAYRGALEEGDHLGDDQRAAVHRRIAGILLGGSDPAAGLDELETARRLHARAGNSVEAAAVAVEAATVLVDGDDEVAAKAALVASRRAAEAAGDQRSLAQVKLLEAARSFRADDADEAHAALLAARDHALAGRDPVDFLAASVAIADLEDGRGHRVEAYRVLASAWVTIADLLGPAAGRTAIEPRLLALRDEWGDEEFAAVKAVHDEQRRAERREAG